MEKIRLALIQYDIAWENPEKNFMLLDEILKPIEANIFILPEMYSTGFTMQPEKFAEPFCGKSFQFLQKNAISKNAVFTASVATRVENQFFNRLYWVEPNETFTYYDKRHLFSLAGEEKHYSAGNERKIINYKEWRWMPQICYDLRFPIWSRNDIDYDVLLYVANWPEKRTYAWNTLLKARAIENQCYVVGVNRIGADGNAIDHSGESMVYNPLGEEMNFEQLDNAMLFEIDKKDLINIRTQFKFLQDQDKFEIK